MNRLTNLILFVIQLQTLEKIFADLQIVHSIFIQESESSLCIFAQKVHEKQQISGANHKY